MKNDLLLLLVKHFNLSGFVVDAVSEVADKALDKLVADSSNPYDNTLKPLLWPLIEKEAIEFANKNLDLKKLLKIPAAE
tara:strand:+ start:12761 stop:12997 length:237 start_codon:yes stop_codon:yes gene_type:complete